MDLDWHTNPGYEWDPLVEPDPNKASGSATLMKTGALHASTRLIEFFALFYWICAFQTYIEQNYEEKKYLLKIV